MQRRWKFLAVTATGMVAASMAFTSLAAGSTAATKVRVLMAPGGDTNRMTVSPTTVKAGTVTFVITNQSNIPKKVNGVVQGSVMTRFVLLKTNLAPDKLPLDRAGHASEKGRVGKAVVTPGKTMTITLDLKPGKYVAISNAGHDFNYVKPTVIRVTS